MEKSKLIKEFQKNKELYEKLGKNIVEALKTFLNEANIPFLDIYYRIKKFDSFFEKIDRTGYTDPITEIEDICGIRIICYYASDIETINQLINKEFNVLEQQDKSDLLGLKEFAYRSNHYIVSINNSWLAAPNYRGLKGLKSEIQVRTILMHAWAEIEHKLNYKSDAQVPDMFQRKLFRLSAKFEEADEQFEELRDGINHYRNQLIKRINSTNKFNSSQDFNLESFIAFINFHFPNMEFNMNHAQKTFEEFNSSNKKFEVLQEAIEFMKPHFDKINSDLVNSGYFNISGMPLEYIMITMDIYDDDTFKKRSHTMNSWRNVVKNWRRKIRTSDNKK